MTLSTPGREVRQAKFSTGELLVARFDFLLRAERDAARAEVERLTRERDEAMAERDLNEQLLNAATDLFVASSHETARLRRVVEAAVKARRFYEEDRSGGALLKIARDVLDALDAAEVSR